MSGRKLYAVGAVAIVVAVLVGIVATSRPPPPPPPAVSDKFDVVLLDLETGTEMLILSNLSDAGLARFMPDGSVVVSGTIGDAHGVWRIGSVGSPVLLWEGSPSWLDPSPDGAQVIWFNGSGIVILDVQNGATSTIPLRALSPALYPLFTTFDPEGRRIAFTWEGAFIAHGPYRNYIATYDLANGIVDVLMKTGKQIAGLAFLPDGEHIVFASDGIYLYDIVLNLTLRLTGPANQAFPQVSGSGDLVVFQSLTRMDALGRPLYRIHIYQLSTGETRDVLQREQYGNPHPDITTDGRAIVFIMQPRL